MFQVVCSVQWRSSFTLKLIANGRQYHDTHKDNLGQPQVEVLMPTYTTT